MSARRPTPRRRRTIPITYLVWIICTAMVAALGLMAVMLHA